MRSEPIVIWLSGSCLKALSGWSLNHRISPVIRCLSLMVATLVCLVGSANVCGQDLNYELSGIVARLDALDRELTMLTGYTLGPSPASDSVMPAAYATDSLAPPVPSLDERLKKIEADLKKQADDAAKKKADDALRPTQRWTGRIQADY